MIQRALAASTAFRRRAIVITLSVLLPMSLAAASPVAALQAEAQVLTWTADDNITRYRSAPAHAVAGVTTIVFENSAATGNTTGMPHTLTFDTATAGYNHDVNLNIFASPFDADNGRQEQTVTLTPGRYRYFCSIPGHGEMVGELVVSADGGTDTTPPAVSATVTGSQDPDGNYVGAATVSVSASDAESGVATVEYQLDDTGFQPYTAPIRVTAIGDHAVQFRATDTAGNTSGIGSVSLRVVAPTDPGDTTAPTVTAALTGDKDPAGNYLGAATVTLTATDTQSGVAAVEYALNDAAFVPYTSPVVVNQPGMTMVRYRATDVAGNVSPVGMVHLTVVAPPVDDTTAPTVSSSVAGERDASGHYLGTATVTVTATDAQSGVATVQYSLDEAPFVTYTAPVAVSSVGAHTVRYRATDKAGNSSPEGETAFTVVAGADACPDSDSRDTVIIDGDDTRIANVDTGNGCTINDVIAERAEYPNHGSFVRHVEAVTTPLVDAGTLTRRQQGTIVRAAARSDIGT